MQSCVCGWMGGRGGGGNWSLKRLIFLFSFFTTRVHKNDEDVLGPVIFMSSRRAPLLFLTENVDIGAGGHKLTSVALFGTFC